jgi:transposase
MIYIGVDLHKRFCYMTAMDATGQIRDQRKVTNDADSLRGYLERWSEPLALAVESCSFWPAFAEAVEALVQRLVLVHPQRVKAIASAKLKNDRVDSATLAHLLRANLLPEAWRADAGTRQLRELVRLRIDLGRQRARWKNRVHALLHGHGLRPPVSDLFGQAGRAWLASIALPAGTRPVLDSCLEMIDQYSRQIRVQEVSMKRCAQADPRVRWLSSIPGIGSYSALVLLAEIGPIERFVSKRQLYSYAGLTPRLRQSAERKRSGGITRAGSPRLRWILVEAATVAARYSPAAQRYYQSLAERKHRNIARVALARKLLGAVWALLRHGVCFDEQVFAAM